MEFELWYLIAVPLLFAAGWYFRGFDIKQGRSANKVLPDNYFRGLSLLLSNEPDKAVDAFIEVVKLDPETIELHHALGNLFSRRGEFERAIRIHTHLINRVDIKNEDRLRALSELSDDYLKAGMYDKATDCLEKLAGSPGHRLEALRAMMRIDCIEHDWPEAIETARRLEKEGSEDRSREISHFHCELALEAARAKKTAEAWSEAEKALEADPQSPRALLLAGDLSLEAGDAAKAVSFWEKASSVSSPHFPLCVARLVKGYDAMGRKEEAERVVEKAMEVCPSAEVVGIAVKRVLATGDKSAATAIVGGALSRHPTLGVLSCGIELRKELNPGDEQLQGLSAMLKKESDKQGRYQCRHCGFLSHSYLWQCPGCGEWDSYPPLHVQDQKAAR